MAQKRGKKGDDAPIILTVNRAQIIAQSKAGKSASDQIGNLEKSVSSQLTEQKTKLEADIENYQKNKELWSKEERQKKEQELAGRSQYGLPQMGKIMESAFVQSVRKAENDILTQAQPIMQEIVDKRGATILLDTSTILYAAEESNITQEVISKLDKKLSKIDVQEVSLEDILRQVAKAQQAQAQQAQ